MPQSWTAPSVRHQRHSPSASGSGWGLAPSQRRRHLRGWGGVCDSGPIHVPPPEGGGGGATAWVLTPTTPPPRLTVGRRGRGGGLGGAMGGGSGGGLCPGGGGGSGTVGWGGGTCPQGQGVAGVGGPTESPPPLPRGRPTLCASKPGDHRTPPASKVTEAGARGPVSSAGDPSGPSRSAGLRMWVMRSVDM